MTELERQQALLRYLRAVEAYCEAVEQLEKTLPAVVTPEPTPNGTR
jgi:hypothetical protein